MLPEHWQLSKAVYLWKHAVARVSNAAVAEHRHSDSSAVAARHPQDDCHAGRIAVARCSYCKRPMHFFPQQPSKSISGRAGAELLLLGPSFRSYSGSRICGISARCSAAWLSKAALAEQYQEVSDVHSLLLMLQVFFALLCCRLNILYTSANALLGALHSNVSAGQKYTTVCLSASVCAL